VPNLIHERELAQARDHAPFEFFGYSDKSWDYEGANIETFSGDHELAKGSPILETPGHTGRPLLLPARGLRLAMLLAMDVAYTAARSRRGSSRASTTRRSTASARSRA
jgi:hypothetical protein